MAEEKGEDVNCLECEHRMPDMMPENEIYLQCFTLCDSQLRPSFSGAFGLDWGVVFEVARTLGIKIDSLFFRLLKVFEDAFLKSINSKQEDRPETEDEYRMSVKMALDNFPGRKLK